MKKTFAILLTFGLLLVSFCGCERIKTDIMPTESQTTAQIEQNFQQASERPIYTTPESLAERLIREIDTQFEADSKLLEYSSTAGQCDLWYKYEQKWRQIADTYYNKIAEYDGIVPPSDIYYTSEDLHTFISDMKANWEVYKQKQCDSYTKTLQAIYAGGSIVGPLSASYACEMQKQWALELVKIYQQLPVG